MNFRIYWRVKIYCMKTKQKKSSNQSLISPRQCSSGSKVCFGPIACRPRHPWRSVFRHKRLFGQFVKIGIEFCLKQKRYLFWWCFSCTWWFVSSPCRSFAFCTANWWTLFWTEFSWHVTKFQYLILPLDREVLSLSLPGPEELERFLVRWDSFRYFQKRA